MKKRTMRPEEADHYARRLRWAWMNQEVAETLAYTWDLAGPDGASFEVFITDETPLIEIAKAVTYLKKEHDVVSITLLVVPQSFIVAQVLAMANEEYQRLRQIGWQKEDFLKALDLMIDDADFPQRLSRSLLCGRLRFKIGDREFAFLPLDNGAKQLVALDGGEVSEEEWLEYCRMTKSLKQA